MKIGNHVETPPVALPSSGAAPRATSAESASNAATAARTAGTASADAGESTTVKLSSTAATLMSSNADFDAEKVAAMKAAIANGTFRVNAEVIADRLISNARELLERPAH
ncbi:flagellar biosynthesis anti-sigma factor FlgM [Eleftheria terrae]|uniref:flagellar biosynthesis anti-sigma factor FlgM n=1 Tax=Eleftheria terrae TaxID=1597781 RepID=UPI00263AC32E|nr:flagellar biosynthesis anti-sigma factor FlgM [Eleftheria terrae]WKB54475.1 flagellar biosynthesis anti-sigma factor FlgM [Eleftheria terrae]